MLFYPSGAMGAACMCMYRPVSPHGRVQVPDRPDGGREPPRAQSPTLKL